MATENPVRMLSRGQMETVLGAFGESLNPVSGGALPSSASREAREIGRLLRGQTRFENFVSGNEGLPHRSGSAPPSVEGSLAAMGGLFAHHPTSVGAGGLLSKLGDGTDSYESEQELRSDPAYLAYYYSHINLNPRLPPPLISWENWRLAQRLQSGLALGDMRKLRSFDDSDSKSLFSTQPVLTPHKEELEDLEEERSPRESLSREPSGNWTGGSRSLIGLSSSGLETRSKSLVELNQDKFSRTPSPVYNCSRPPSREAILDDTVGDLDVQLSHMRNATVSSVTELNAATRPLSRSRTPIPGAAQILGFPPSGSSSEHFIPTARSSTPEPPVVRSATPGRMLIGGTDVGGDSYNVAASAAELAAALQNISVSHGAVGSTLEDHEHFQQPDTREQQQNYSRQQQRRRQHGQTAQTHMQGIQTQVYPQVQQHQHVYSSVSEAQSNATKFTNPSIESQGQSSNLFSNIHAGAVAPNMYAAAAAAMSYMAAANPYYQNLHSAAIYGPQYGVGGYSLNPNVIPPMIAGYPALGALPLGFDTTAAAAASMAARAAVPGSHGLTGAGVDIQQFYKYTGHAAPTFQSPIPDPLYYQYMQRAAENAHAAAAGSSDPSLIRTYPGGVPVEDIDPHKGQAGTLGYTTDQKSSQHRRSGTLGVPVTNKMGPVSSAYYGSPHGVSFLLPNFNSPIGSPVLPGSPVALSNIALRRDDRALRLPSGPGRTSGGVHAGWQSPRSSDTSDLLRASSLLEEFKNNKTRRFELSDITGHVVEFSADQHGSRFIQQKLETASLEEKVNVFEEVLPRALSLMTDVFGNYVIQKFFEHGTPEQRKELANQLIAHVLTLSLQMYGCRVIQKALEVVDAEQQTKLVSELDGHVMRCVRDQNGNHVIQKCIECVPSDRIHFIISAFYGQVVVLSTHPYGCRVIQRVLEHCTDVQKQHAVMEEILSATCSLAQDQYGNYVVQHVLEHGRPLERSEIIKKLAGQIVQMSQHKFASNVIEKCLEFGGPEERQILITEMLGYTDANEPLQAMMKDQFANYVVQKVLETCDDQQRELLLSRIRVHLHALKKYTYGKHIVARVEKLLAAGERRSAAQVAHTPA
ncbi:hypothetical protein O6H91_02G073000 [Diphasiastrum complanatum]|uniref:Uncharacterized protein n=7 Tax=Diphasiastrum complanatum TaxID=34168 RepID=A0ACC2EH81_DIPCM|nr:hypothetical protein O6H91_02G073000 [Diphasiastrum complanatum]KAJ7565742.1 hypothetical protein O6H91_02G073000 [Diphasiastrum complanatum]KAJ7565743.1 hypothetical protein O6H91_02G073000 [Diphasiastrum complanatum]KAJ7565745.1 hypothetical protein O6H91_02G073000 [Diphasiastrum complanatum]KAJ7565746.1 hypothetical protein O6H91_02G073000 [Diphasiastrum complanatum]